MKNFKYTTEEKRGKLCGKLINGINSLASGRCGVGFEDVITNYVASISCLLPGSCFEIF